MSRLNLNDPEVLDALTLEYAVADQDVPVPHHIRYRDGWRPSLNPIQKAAVESKAIYKLYYGERYSGKSYGGLHELVDYLYRNDNTLGYIVVKEVGIGTQGGAWHKLEFEVLPLWVEGIGIQHTRSKLDAKTKNPYMWISNRHGGWSMVMLTSLPISSQVDAKIRGREPQIILVDEAQFLEGEVYFTALLMQLGRRTIKGGDPAKLIFAVNPQGPRHWLYKKFFVDPVDPATGEWDPRYGKFHIPVSDNKPNLPERYYEDYVLPAVKNDPIEEARLVRGEWVDRPDGATLFGEAFIPNLCVKGDAAKGTGLIPVPGHPIFLSYDLGAAHSVVYFKQIIPADKIYKLTIDEVDYVGEYVPYPRLVPFLIRRMIYWETTMKCEFRWLHISDNSAFNQYRATTGSYDHWDVEKISAQFVADNGLSPRFVIKMKECPKPEHSIEARVRMVSDDLSEERVLISATCTRLIEMFQRLQEDPNDRLKPKKKARYGHNFDAWTYGDFYFKQTRTGRPRTGSEKNSNYYPVG